MPDREEELALALESIYDRNSKVSNADDEQEVQPPREPPGLQTPTQPRRFVNFITPQVKRAGPRTQGGGGRYSYGGAGLDNGGARRVLVEQSWRVKDIVLPQKTIKEERDEDERRDVGGWNEVGVKKETQRERLSDEERKVRPSHSTRHDRLIDYDYLWFQAIQERRRSALRTPDAFFGGQAPGMRRLSAFPAPPTFQPASLSPVKGVVPSTPKQGIIKLEQEEFKVNVNERRGDEDGSLDTRSLLERMKETVEGMKRRKSLNPRASLGLGMSPSKRRDPREDTGFSLLAPGVKEELQLEMDVNKQGGKTDGKVGSEQEDSGTVEDQLMTSGDEGDDDSDKMEVEAVPGFPPKASDNVNASMKTPRMDDLRHVFAVPKPAVTPSFKGVRGLFAYADTRAPGTPVFEGMGEMLRTPAGYRYSERVDPEDEGEREDVTGRKPTSSNTAGRRAGRVRAADSASTTGDEVSKQESAPRGKRGKVTNKLGESDLEDLSAAVTKPRGRVLRGKKKVVEETSEV